MSERGRLMSGVNRWGGRGWVAAGICAVMLAGGLASVEAAAAAQPAEPPAAAGDTEATSPLTAPGHGVGGRHSPIGESVG